MLIPRKDRRKEVREQGVPFEPIYNGEKPKTHEEMFGIGYERFDDKYTKVSELIGD